MENGFAATEIFLPDKYIEPKDSILLACLNKLVEACLLTKEAAITFLATLDFTKDLAAAVRVALESIV